MRARKELEPQATVRRELSSVPKGRHAEPASCYRTVYAMVRQAGLGKRPGVVPPTREFAHAEALAEARKVDPGFDLPLPEPA